MKILIKFHSVEDFKDFAKKYNKKNPMYFNSYEQIMEYIKPCKSEFMIQIINNRYLWGRGPDGYYIKEGFTIITLEQAYKKYLHEDFVGVPKKTKYLFES